MGKETKFDIAIKPKGDDLTESYKKPPEKIKPPAPKPPPAPPPKLTEPKKKDK